jgi:hypothetical protein
VIFLDELTTTALLRAVVDRALGDLQLDPSRVMIIAAANPSDQAAGGWELAAPLTNRFLHASFEITASRWTNRFVYYWDAAPRVDRLPFDSETASASHWGNRATPCEDRPWYR